MASANQHESRWNGVLAPAVARLRLDGEPGVRRYRIEKTRFDRDRCFGHNCLDFCCPRRLKLRKVRLRKGCVVG